MFLSDQPLFHVGRDVPIADALAQASDLLFLAKSLTVDAAYAQDSDRHAWAAHYLTTMSKAVIDDVVKVLTRKPAQTGANESAGRSVKQTEPENSQTGTERSLFGTD
jgi:hypothetical protein